MQGCEATSHVGKLKDYKSPYDTNILSSQFYREDSGHAGCTEEACIGPD